MRNGTGHKRCDRVISPERLSFHFNNLEVVGLDETHVVILLNLSNGPCRPETTTHACRV